MSKSMLSDVTTAQQSLFEKLKIFSILSSFKLGTFAHMASKKEDFRTKMQLLKVSCSNAGGKILDLV